MISVTIDRTFKYIILMSDGVYKTLEAIDGGDSKKSRNELLVETNPRRYRVPLFLKSKNP